LAVRPSRSYPARSKTRPAIRSKELARFGKIETNPVAQSLQPHDNVVGASRLCRITSLYAVVHVQPAGLPSIAE